MNLWAFLTILTDLALGGMAYNLAIKLDKRLTLLEGDVRALKERL